MQSLIYNRRAVFNLRTVEFALNGDEALAQATASVPNLSVCDVMMLGNDDFSVCEALRKKTKHIPVILLTALPDSGNVEKLAHGAAECIIVPPFDRDQLLEGIAEHLNAFR
mgnify:CR=1 FL=1